MTFIKTILCPVDFSAGSQRAVDHAAQLAELSGAKLELMHAYQIPQHTFPGGVVTPVPEYVTKVVDQAQGALVALQHELNARGLEASTHLVAGYPPDAILARAEEIGASLLVLGTHGRTGFSRFLVGSTTERVVRLARLPVLSIPLAADA